MQNKSINKNIFIDTCIFEKHGYCFDHPTLTALVEMQKKVPISVYTTDIIIREIKSRVKEKILGASRAKKRLNKELKILRTLDESDYGYFFNKIDVEKAINDFENKLKAYLHETSSKEIDVYSFSSKIVFDQYFAHQHPFKEGKNKYEFPDAFMIEGVHNWCKENDEKIYMISSDKAIIGSCSENGPLISLKSVEEFLSIINFENEHSSEILELFNKHIGEVHNKVSDEFTSRGFFLEDQDGDVEDIDVKTINIEEIYILSISSINVIIEAEIELDYSAFLTYGNYDTAVFDNEDGLVMFLENVEKTVEKSYRTLYTIKLFYDPDNIDLFKIVSIDPTEISDIGIDSEEYDDDYDLK